MSRWLCHNLNVKFITGFDAFSLSLSLSLLLYKKIFLTNSSIFFFWYSYLFMCKSLLEVRTGGDRRRCWQWQIVLNGRYWNWFERCQYRCPEWRVKLLREIAVSMDGYYLKRDVFNDEKRWNICAIFLQDTIKCINLKMFRKKNIYFW